MKVGQVLGHYHVIRTLGHGGMGAVYEASDTRLNRQVALKVLPAKMANNPEWFKRFEREAQAVAALNHPNIVTIHSVEEADDVHFIILELVGGKTLDEMIPEGGLSIEDFFDVAIPLTDAIAAAHRRGIAHRDLKPANVMVDDEGRVKVLDFGIAKLVEEEIPDDEAATQIGSEALTEEGKIVGTVAYMSPEQAEGKAADHRTDIFSLGILLYEMATGDRPFVGETKLSILASIVKDDPQPIFERNMEMPRHLARIVKKALEKDLSRRYQSVVELKNDLVELKEEIDAGEPLITGGALTDPGGMEAYRAPAPAATASKGIWLGIAGVAVAAAALAYAFFGRGGAPPAATGPVAGTVTPLTTTGTDAAGTISPDGEWFAFARQVGDDYWIHLQTIGARTSLELSTQGMSPAFSRDGALIAFSGKWLTDNDYTQGGGISVMGRTGDNLRTLTDTGFNPSWSPDGSRIVYADEFVQANPYSRTTAGSKLHVVDTVTGDSEALAFDLPGIEIDDAVQPAWSPNGHRIAFWGIAGGGQRDLWTVAAEGGEAIRVTNDAAVDFSPAWSHDGNWLYFASTRGGSMAIWRIPIDETTGEILGGAESVTTGGLTEPGMLSFSEDGSKLLYTATLSRGNIAVADFDPNVLALTSAEEPLVQGNRRIYQVDIANDGRLVYRSGGSRQDLFVSGADGTGERQITDDAAKDWAPSWSPDGSRIVYYSDKSNTYEVWTINPDGTQPMQMTSIPDMNPLTPRWSPDGLRIMFSGREHAVHIIDATVGAAEQEWDTLPRVDPRRDDLGFLATDWREESPTIVGNYEGLRVFDPESRTFALISTEAAADARWMADGHRILFRVPGAHGFFVADVDSPEATPIHIDIEANELVLSPDNLRAYLVREESDSDIWMLDLGGQ